MNDPKCGYVSLSVEGTVITEFCNGPNRVTRHADGKGGSFEVISAINDPECGYVAPTPPPPPPPTEAPPPGETPTSAPPPINSGVSLFSNTSLANVGDKETFTIKVANLKPYSSYVVNIASYATINRAGIQQIANQVVITDGGGNGTAAYEYSVTEEIFSIAQATSNINQITVMSKATINDIGDQYTSNEVSKQVRRGGGAPPVTTPPSPPPSGNYNVFLAFDPNNDRTQPTTVVPTSQQLRLTGGKNKAGSYYNAILNAIERKPAGILYIIEEKAIKSVTTGSPAGVYITHYVEILDDQGRIVLARAVVGRSVTAASGANWSKLYVPQHLSGVFDVLGNGMTYKARIKAVRESDNVVSYSDMWPCEYYLRPDPADGGG